MHRFDGSDEAAHEFSVNVFRHQLDIETRPDEELTGVGSRIDTGRFNADLLEARLL